MFIFRIALILFIISYHTEVLLSQSEEVEITVMEKQVCNLCFSDQVVDVVKIFDSTAVVLLYRRKKGTAIRNYVILNIYGDVIKTLGNHNQIPFVCDSGQIIIKVSKYNEPPKYKILNRNGKEVCSDLFDDFNFKDGRLLLSKNGIMGLINENCFEIIPFQYEELKTLAQNRFVAKNGDESFIIDITGEIIEEIKFDSNSILLNLNKDILRVVLRKKNRWESPPKHYVKNDLFRIPNYNSQELLDYIDPWKGDDRHAIIVDSIGNLKLDTFSISNLYIAGGTLNIGRKSKTENTLLHQPVDYNFNPLSLTWTRLPQIEVEGSFITGYQSMRNLFSPKGDTLLKGTREGARLLADGILQDDEAFRSFYDYQGNLIRRQLNPNRGDSFKPTDLFSCNLKKGYILDSKNEGYDIVDITTGKVTLSSDSLQILRDYMTHSLIPARDSSWKFDFYNYNGERITNCGFYQEMDIVGDYYIVEENGLKNIMDSEGIFMLDTFKDRLQNVEYGYYIYADKHQKLNIMDRNFNDIFDRTYDRIYVLNKNLFIVSDHLRGTYYMDKNEIPVSNKIYRDITKLNDDLYKLIDSSYFEFVNKDREPLFDHPFDIERSLPYRTYSHVRGMTYLYKVCFQGKCGIRNGNATLILPLEFEDIQYFTGNFLRLLYKGNWIKIDKKGECVENCPDDITLNKWGLPWKGR